MSEIGFDLDLRGPPLLTIKGKNFVEVQRIRSLLLKYKKENEFKEKEFAETATLLGRLMARRKNSFKKFILFRFMQKMNSAALRLLAINLNSDLESVIGALPDNFEVIDSEVDLPTRCYLEYLLIRIYDVYGVHERIRDCCLQCGDFTTKLLFQNFFVDISTLLLAVFAKINSLNTFLGNQCKDLYNVLMENKKFFPKHKTKSFLKKHLDSMPNKLESLSVRKIENETENAEVKAKKPNIILLKESVPFKAPVITKSQQKQDDLGVAVERKELKAYTNVEKKLEISKLKTIDDIKNFIKTENQSRKDSLEKALTKNIANHEWSGAQKILGRKIQGNKKLAINFFTNFLKNKI